MLRLLVLLLIFANALYFGWTSGLLRAYGFAPVQQSEPQHYAQQIQPEAVTLLSAAEFKHVEAQLQADLAPKECLTAGPFDDAQLAPLRKSLESALPGAAWQIDAVQQPARWIIYMGKFPTADALAKKRTELLTLKLSLEPLQNANLEPGLSLGAFGSQVEATDALARLAQRGIHTARVVQEREATRAFQLKMPAVTDAMKRDLSEVRPALAGLALKPCD
jgi:hypothetical protein